MDISKPVVRLYLFFATENDSAVILRQGPSKQYRMILWHRDTDTFEDGQWLKHKVYVEWCDLSPDGRHFIYFAVDGKWSSEGLGAYTAVSRPPYFTALSLFPEGAAWVGGGRFLDNRHYVAVGRGDRIAKGEGIERLLRKEPTKDCATGLFRIDGRCAPIGKANAAKLELAEPECRSTQLNRYDTMGGCLYRRLGQELELIRDFTEMEFKPMRAPYDWRDENDDAAPWHPLDGSGA